MVRKQVRAEDMALLREAVAKQRPDLVPLLEMLGQTPLGVEERDRLVKGVGYALRIADSERDHRWRESSNLRAQFSDLRNYIWTSHALLREDMALLREAVAKQRPDLVALLEMLGQTPLTAEQRRELALSLNDEFLATGLRADREPNPRGLRLEALTDYIGYM